MFSSPVGIIETVDPGGRVYAGPGEFSQYLLDVSVSDPIPPLVASIGRLPGEGGTTSRARSTFSVTFSEALAPATVNDLLFSPWDLREAGVDGQFGTSDDDVYNVVVSPSYTGGTTVNHVARWTACGAPSRFQHWRC